VIGATTSSCSSIGGRGAPQRSNLFTSERTPSSIRIITDTVQKDVVGVALELLQAERRVSVEALASAIVHDPVERVVVIFHGIHP
jgi:hypothetical protein